jgi:hypothetical protein
MPIRRSTTIAQLQSESMTGRPSARSTGAVARYVLLPGVLAKPWLPLLILLGLTAITALARPVIGGLDTPSLSAAWEMARDGNWMAEDGLAATVPPLLPCLLVLAWSAFGVGLASAWAICALGLAVGLLLTRRLATRLWPQRADVGPLASWVFAGSAGILLLGPAIAPECIGLALTASGLYALALIGDGKRRGWPLFSLSLALLLLTTGSLGCTVLLLPALFGPVWTQRSGAPAWIMWYAAFAAAVAFALLPFLLWSSYLAVDSTAVITVRLAPSLLPLFAMSAVLYPWPYWPRFWRSVRRQSKILNDPGFRLCAIASVLPLIAFVAGGSGIRTLLLLGPATTAVIARLLAGRLPGRADFPAGIPSLFLIPLALVPIAINTVPWAQLVVRAQQFLGTGKLPLWLASIGVGGTVVVLGGVFLLVQATPRLLLSRVAQVALLPLILAAAVTLEMTGELGRSFDLMPVAARISALQSNDAPVAVLAIDPSTYAFAGRLKQPLTVLSTEQSALDWAHEHADGTVIAPFHGSVLRLLRQPGFAAQQGASWVAFWPAQTIMETGGAALRERP